MKYDLGTIEFERIIVHKVPKHVRKVDVKSYEEEGKALPHVEYSEVESPLTTETQNYFTERIQESLRLQHLYVHFDEEESNVVCDVVSHCLQHEEPDFIGQSKSVADHLYESQNAINSGGLVLVAQAKIEGLPAIAILKLEEEAAIQFKRAEQEGKPTFVFTHLEDLTMTKNTKVFKAGLFVQESTEDGSGSIEGFISDNQRGKNEDAGVADFFLRKFLGCKLRNDPAVQVSKTYNAVVDWIKKDVKDPVLEANYLEAVHVTLRSNEKEWNVEEMAEKHFDPDQLDSFFNSLSDKGLSNRILPMETALVDRQTKYSTWTFDSGIFVRYPTGTWTDHISVEEGESGNTILQIVDKTKKVR